MTVNNLRPLENQSTATPQQGDKDEASDPQAHVQTDILERIIMMLFLFMVNFAYSLNATIYCIFPVYEREFKITYSLRVGGCQDKPYWIGTFIFDFIAIQLVNVVLIVLIFVFQIEFLF